jgi:capsid protein
MFCNPVWRAFVDTAYAAGRIPEPDYRCEWHPPRFETVDPMKEAEALRTNIRLGVVSWSQAVSSYGNDPEEQRAAIVEDNKANDAAGFVHDGDARNRTANGNEVKWKEEAPPPKKEE